MQSKPLLHLPDMYKPKDIDMEYNTARTYLTMREYGRHIQKMVDYLLTIDDAKERQDQAHVVIELMGFLNPHLRNVEDFRHKLWDHLFFMSDFKLKVESPYPIPEKATYKSKPDPLPYPKRYPKYSHLGKNLELVVNKALKEESQEKKDGFAHAIAYYMKLAYSNWHKELVHDDAIRSEMNTITGGQLEFSNTPYIKHRNQNFERDDYSRSSGGRGGDRDRSGGSSRQQNYMGGRGGTSRSTGGRDNRDSRDSRGGSSSRNTGGRDMRDNRGGGGSAGGDKRNNNNRNQGFKKRF